MSNAARLSCHRLASSLKSQLLVNSSVAVQLASTREYVQGPKLYKSKFMVYVKDQISAMRKQHPEKNIGEINSLLSKTYANLEEHEKEEIKRRHSELVQQAQADWDSLSGEERATIIEERKQRLALKRMNKERRQLKAEFLATDPPKKPLTIYAKFLQQWHSSRQNQQRVNLMESNKECAAAFKSLPPAEIEELKAEYGAKWTTYNGDKMEWVQKLVEEGKTHLIVSDVERRKLMKLQR